ncbi:MAG TPA: ABC transporter permease, partial [Tenacibaculum sp.]|nr:ABC transporter permease [Tenacibaculum sp.]
GVFVGALLVFMQIKYGLFMITNSLPYPVELKWTNFFIVITTISCLGIMASKIASSRISKEFIEG